MPAHRWRQEPPAGGTGRGPDSIGTWLSRATDLARPTEGSQALVAESAGRSAGLGSETGGRRVVCAGAAVDTFWITLGRPGCCALPDSHDEAAAASVPQEPVRTSRAGCWWGFHGLRAAGRVQRRPVLQPVRPPCSLASKPVLKVPGCDEHALEALECAANAIEAVRKLRILKVITEVCFPFVHAPIRGRSTGRFFIGTSPFIQPC